MIELTPNQTNVIPFVMVDTNDDEAAGLTLSVAVSKNAGAFAAGAGTASEIGSGWYAYLLTAAECNTPGPLALKVTAPGARQQNIVATVVGAAPGAIAYDYTLTSDIGGTPIVGASIWATTDGAGLNTVATGTTNAFGVATLYLQPGTYYIWRAAPGYTFANPDTEIVSAS